jgi:predicted DsbA family dithiol-disulfide isomerase
MKIEIWSDVVCPWCYIGKRRLESALQRFAHRESVEVLWRSFELDPSAPPIRTGDSAQRLADKYGMSLHQARQRQGHIAQLAAAEGLQFRFDVAQSGNTFDAHRMLHLAHERGVQDEVKERLFRAYFTEGEPIGDRETLVRLVSDAGIAVGDARTVVESERFADDVRADEREARELGINGVPFFVLDRRYGVSGAQPTAVLLQALDQRWAETHAAHVLTTVGAGAGDAVCTDETCAT